MSGNIKCLMIFMTSYTAFENHLEISDKVGLRVYIEPHNAILPKSIIRSFIIALYLETLSAVPPSECKNYKLSHSVCI